MLKPTIEVNGPVAFHDMPCAVEPGEKAIYRLWDGNFEPSRKAQEKGWRLVQGRTRLGVWVLDTFFK